MGTDNTARVAPPYVAFSTLKAFIEKLHKTAVPNVIDRSVMPKMSGVTQGQITAAMKYLGLIGADGTTTEALRKLVKSYETADWNDTLTQVIFDAYDGLAEGIDLDNGTSKQLYEAFRTRGKVEGQLLTKAVRFWLKAHAELGTKLSPHFADRAPRSPNPEGRKPAPKPEGKPKETNTPGGAVHRSDHTPAGTVTFPIPRPGEPLRRAVVPEDIDEADCEMLSVILMAYAKRRREGADK